MGIYIYNINFKVNCSVYTATSANKFSPIPHCFSLCSIFCYTLKVNIIKKQPGKIWNKSVISVIPVLCFDEMEMLICSHINAMQLNIK